MQAMNTMEQYINTVIESARNMLAHGCGADELLLKAEGMNDFIPAEYVRESFSLTGNELEVFYLLVAALYDSDLCEGAYGRASQFGYRNEVFYGNRLHPLVEAFILESSPILPEHIRLKMTSEATLYHNYELLGEMERYFQTLTSKDMPAAIVLTGKRGSGRSFLLEQLGAKRGLNLIYTDNRCRQEDITPLYLMTVLYQAVICLNEPTEHHPVLASHRFGLVFLVGENGYTIDTGRTSLHREVKAVTAKQCQIASIELTGEDLSSYGCTIGQLMAVKHRQRGEEIVGNKPTGAELLKGLISKTEQWERFEINKRFDELVLPFPQKSQLIDICEYIKNRELVYSVWGFDKKITYGKGITMLFYGAPGTGKTLAAGIMANELNLPLCRIDLSQLISKYIGETQKNIGKVFEAAKEQSCILFFDEADALFARRSEQNDAQDKYSNAEIAYLLQKTEGYDGVIILATNLMQNFDEAFRRRIGYMIYFPVPDAALRKMLWEGIFPTEAPTEGLDFTLLSELELTGAGIKNTAVNAAYMAAIDKNCKKITMRQIMKAALLEYQKQGKPFSDKLKRMFEIGEKA